MQAVKSCVWAIGKGFGLSHIIEPAKIALSPMRLKRETIRNWADMAHLSAIIAVKRR
jgi:hypothetical protein